MEDTKLTLNDEENDDNVTEKAEEMDFDTFLDSMGKISNHQLLSSFAVMCTLCLGVSSMTMSPIFLSATPDHRCALPGIDEMENASDLIEYIIPITSDSQKYDPCHRYSYNLSVCKENDDYSCVTNTSHATLIPCDQGYYYDKSIYKESAVTQWNLVCDRAILDAVANSLFFFGFLLGALSAGIISDWCGRRQATLIFCVMFVSFGVSCSFAKNFALYMILRMGVAASTIGSFISSLNYVGEISNRKWRVHMLLTVPTIGSIGCVLVAIPAYYFRDWKNFQMACSLSPLTYIPVYLLTSESPRWLLSKGKEEKAKAVVQRYSRSLGVVPNEEYWQLVLKCEQIKRQDETAKQKYSFADLFKHHHIRLLSLNIMFSWSVAAMVYYGLVLNIGNLAGDPYVNTAINSSMDVISGGILYVLIRFTSIRSLVFATFLLAGFSCLGSMLCLQFGLVIHSVILACLGRLGVSGCLKTIIVLTSEVYPTVTRGIGVGLGSMSARIGSIISPFTLQAQMSYPWLMQTVFGCLSIMAGIASLFYPDTSKTKLLTSIGETEKFLANSKRPTCRKQQLRHEVNE